METCNLYAKVNLKKMLNLDYYYFMMIFWNHLVLRLLFFLFLNEIICTHSAMQINPKYIRHQKCIINLGCPNQIDTHPFLIARVIPR